jgi:MarC family membrane protein
MHASSSLLSSFVTLFVTIGPIETAVIFASLTSGTHHKERRSLALRSVAIAGLMLLLFALGGNLVLSLLHVSLPAFRVAGGMLLFLQALTLTFSSPGLSSINEGERQDAEKPGDIAVFPLAFPLIASPGALSAVVLCQSRCPIVLKGASPGELSLERVTPYELIVIRRGTSASRCRPRCSSGRESKCSKAGRPPWKFHAVDFCQPIAGAHSPCGLSLRTNTAN